MPNDFQQNMDKNSDSYKIIFPILKKILKPDYEIISVENENSKIAKLLDSYSGIDFLLLNTATSELEGVASRIQYDKLYNSFTIRLGRESGVLTEFQKRNTAIKNNSLFPKFTLQSYILSTGEFSMAICKTVELFSFINNFPQFTKCTNEDQIGQASFVVCYWDDLIKNGVNVSVTQGRYTL